jgi:TatD DNase family protein
VIDSHAHLGADAADVLERAHAAGVTRIVVVATTVAGARDALTLADQHEGVYACLGVHPHEAGEPGDVDELRALLAHPKAVAVGETGLDYFRDYAPHDAQQRLFEQELAIALELRKPVVIHTRAADDDTRERLVGHDGTVILHCFSSPPLLEAALAHDWYVSFAGNVTYKNAYDLRDCARRVPSERLLVETDSPYLAAQAVRGRRNEPAYVVHTYDFLSELRGDDVRRLSDANATRAFGLP